MKFVFFHDIFNNVLNIYKGKNLVWQLIAIVFTMLIVMTGLDWQYYEITRSQLLRMMVFPAIAIGGVLPIFLPLILLGIGHIKKIPQFINAGWGVGQAAFLGLVISSCYKAFTGRIPPVFAQSISGLDTSHGFQFGFMEGGVFWGWPSSHTTIAFAMAACISGLFPEYKILRYGSFIYASYVAFSVSVSIHWFSEAVAGIIFGTIIGYVVGVSFKNISPSPKLLNA